MSEEIAEDEAGTSIERVESCGVSELISGGVELLEPAQELLLSEHGPQSPLANSSASRMRNTSISEEDEILENVAAVSTQLNTEEDYTMSGDESRSDSPLKPMPQEFLKLALRSPHDTDRELADGGDASQEDSERVQASNEIEGEVHAIFMACLAAGNKMDGETGQEISNADPVRLRFDSRISNRYHLQIRT